MVKARQFGEVLATDLVRRGRVKVEGARQIDRLRALGREGFLHGDVGPAFDLLRGVGNRAVHHHLGTGNDADAQRTALETVQTCFRLGVWFHRLLTGTRDQMPFIPPEPPPLSASSSAQGIAALRADLQQARQALIEARLTFRDGADRAEAEARARSQAEAELAQARAAQQELIALVAQMRQELTEVRPPVRVQPADHNP